MNNKLLLTIPEACERLSVGRTFFYEDFVRTGRLPVVRLGRSVRIPAAAVAQLVEELTAAATNSETGVRA